MILTQAERALYDQLLFSLIHGMTTEMFRQRPSGGMTPNIGSYDATCLANNADLLAKEAIKLRRMSGSFQ
jgi:hypothetical protein